MSERMPDQGARQRESADPHDVRTSGLITAGETMGLVTAAETGLLDYARGFTLGIGGTESNVAIGVARLGPPVTWFGRIGADAVADLIERRLRAEGISTLAVRDRSYTGLMVKHRRPHATQFGHCPAIRRAFDVTPVTAQVCGNPPLRRWMKSSFKATAARPTSLTSIFSASAASWRWTSSPVASSTSSTTFNKTGRSRFVQVSSTP